MAVPSDRELQALKIIWHKGEATVRDICDAMLERGEQLAYTTVLSLMQVMEQKGFVGHTANGKVYSYFAKVEKESTFRDLAKGFLESVFDGAMDDYLLHAIESRPVSHDELSRLERMISAAKSQKSDPSPSRGTPQKNLSRRKGGET